MRPEDIPEQLIDNAHKHIEGNVKEIFEENGVEYKEYMKGVTTTRMPTGNYEAYAYVNVKFPKKGNKKLVNDLIHAGWFLSAVEKEFNADPYWKNKYGGYKMFTRMEKILRLNV